MINNNGHKKFTAAIILFAYIIVFVLRALNIITISWLVILAPLILVLVFSAMFLGLLIYKGYKGEL